MRVVPERSCLCRVKGEHDGVGWVRCGWTEEVSSIDSGAVVIVDEEPVVSHVFARQRDRDVVVLIYRDGRTRVRFGSRSRGPTVGRRVASIEVQGYVRGADGWGG